MLRRVMSLLCLSLIVLAGGCTRTLDIDTRYSSRNHDSRVQYIIVHYTSSGFDRALQHLVRGDVSSHYLISEEPVIYRLVEEDRRAWHAGDSSWEGRTWLNASSIGIEIVHPGYTDTPAGRVWHPWPAEQIDALLPLLKDLMERHDLGPDRVIGHSDVAPQRKVDPGPLFPWQRLAEAGVAISPDAEAVERYRLALGGQAPPRQWFEMALPMFGYRLEPDAADTAEARALATRNVIAAFQMRFRPARHDGVPDAETAAILAALVPAAVNSPLWCLPPAAGVSPGNGPADSPLPTCADPEIENRAGRF